MSVPPVDQLLKLPLSLQREPEGLDRITEKQKAESRRQKAEGKDLLPFLFAFCFLPSAFCLQPSAIESRSHEDRIHRPWRHGLPDGTPSRKTARSHGVEPHARKSGAARARSRQPPGVRPRGMRAIR